ncbi:hypothetical protein FQR65_LT15922 [Abscondita terminalis]|nr:hypothetical protein FQR65_LT15922 [Abscondita terminalis]
MTDTRYRYDQIVDNLIRDQWERVEPIVFTLSLILLTTDLLARSSVLILSYSVDDGDTKTLAAMAVRGESPLLFDLNRDKGETRNLAETHPQKVKELTALLQHWEQGLDNPHWTSSYGDYNQIMKHKMDVIGRNGTPTIMCFLVLILTKSVSAQATYPFGTISKRIVDDHLRTEAGADKRAEDMLARMKLKTEAGEDIDYADVVLQNGHLLDPSYTAVAPLFSPISQDEKHYNCQLSFIMLLQA